MFFKERNQKISTSDHVNKKGRTFSFLVSKTSRQEDTRSILPLGLLSPSLSSPFREDEPFSFYDGCACRFSSMHARYVCVHLLRAFFVSTLGPVIETHPHSLDEGDERKKARLREKERVLGTWRYLAP